MMKVTNIIIHIISKLNMLLVILTLFRMGGAKKPPLSPVCTIFSPVTSTNIGISAQNFLTFNPYKIEVMITPLIEMLELPNFGHMSTSTK